MELRFVAELATRVRTIIPTEHQWLESADILSRIRGKKGYDVNKLRELAFDVLIALSARGVGATLITCNRKDFTEIGKWITFKVVYW